MNDMRVLVRRPGPGSRVTVVGLAKSGASAARFLLGLGCQVRVTEKATGGGFQEEARLLERQGAAVEIGRHTQEFIRGSQLVVASPGVPSESPPIRWALQAGIPVVSELELGSWYARGRLVAVTGSNGKSTVVTLLGEVLKEDGKEVVVCGNIGIPLTACLDRIRPSTWVVLEVSSFQLESSLSFHAEIACLLNVTDNHLDRHRTFHEYKQAKAKLFAHQKRSGRAVLNADDPASWSMRGRLKSGLAAFSRRRRVEGAFIEKDHLILDLGRFCATLCHRDELARQGSHHEENALAVSCIAGLMEVSPRAITRVLKSFRGLPHRQEVVATISGVTFVNDSKSTTLASGLRAIEAARGPVILIAGGRDKGSDFRKLSRMRGKLKAAILIGEDGSKIASALQGAVSTVEAGDLEEAVSTASRLARPGEWVLLSPMCTSFDMFHDFEERGERFKEAVAALTGGPSRP